MDENLKAIRDQITFRCVKSLSAYRKHVATSQVIGQLILPESYKLFPLYALALQKSKSFTVAGNLSMDERNFNMKMMLKMNVAGFVALFYPRMVPVHTLTEKCGYRNDTGRVNLPTRVRLTSEWLEETGIYILGLIRMFDCLF